MINRTVTKTTTGFRVYGTFTCVMDLDTNGNVTYSNMVAGTKEYRAMYRAYKSFAD